MSSPAISGAGLPIAQVADLVELGSGGLAQGAAAARYVAELLDGPIEHRLGLPGQGVGVASGRAGRNTQTALVLLLSAWSVWVLLQAADQLGLSIEVLAEHQAGLSLTLRSGFFARMGRRSFSAVRCRGIGQSRGEAAHLPVYRRGPAASRSMARLASGLGAAVLDDPGQGINGRRVVGLRFGNRHELGDELLWLRVLLLDDPAPLLVRSRLRIHLLEVLPGLLLFLGQHLVTLLRRFPRLRGLVERDGGLA